MKKQIKKLSLNKKTISNLSSSEMNKLVGGVSDFTCTTCPTLLCPTHLYCTQACATQNCGTQAGQATCYKHGHTC